MSEVLRRSFLLLTAAAFCMAALLCFLPAAGHDQLWFLLMARRWLHGAPLYGPEIFDANPPLVVWLSAVPVEIGDLSGFAATTVAKSLVLATGLGIAALCSAILRRVWHPIARGEGSALLFAFTVLFFVLPARDLGQRDALVPLLALPYVLAAARRPTQSLPRSTAIAAGLLAALAFCLKPQDALLGIAVELTILARNLRTTRSGIAGLRQTLARPELPVLLGCGALFLLAIRIWAPLYFTETLPILHETYWAIGGLSLPSLLGQAVELVLLLAVTLTLFLCTGPVAPAAWTLLLAGCGGAVAYLLQGTGWYYQQLPALCLVGTALSLHLLDCLRRRPLHPPRWIVPAVASLCTVAVALTTHFTGYPFTRSRAFNLTSPSPALFTGIPTGTPIAILTTSVDESMMPIEYFHLTWAQRTNNLWLLPAILLSEAPDPGKPRRHRLSPAALAALEALQHRWMVEDLTHWQPERVLVERCESPEVSCQILEDSHPNLLAWFNRDPAFRSIWQHYHRTAADARFDLYTRIP